MIYELWLALFPHALNPFGQQSSDDKMWLERMGLKRTKSKASLSPTSVSRLIPELLPGLSTETVISLKTKGNEYFGKEAYDKAEIEYTKALDCFARSPAGDAMERDWTPSPMDDSDSDNLIGLGTSLLSNRSAALLHLGNWTGSIRDATQVIILRPSWVKGYFRRAEALHAQKEFSTALIDYQTAINCDPLNVTLQCKAKTTAVKVQEDKDGLLIRQLQTGREICQKSLFSPVQSLVFDYAVKMQNYIYFVGDARSRECLIIDACWDATGILRYAQENNLKIVGVIATHYHFDHVGGTPPPPFDSYRVKVEGMASILKALPHIQAYAHPEDIDEILKNNPELSRDKFVPTADGFTLSLPLTCSAAPSDACPTRTRTRLKFIHTPGHTPGSQCILANETSLFSGDTLFVGSCGRIDFPESNPQRMWASLSQTLQSLDDAIGVYPGHAYSGSMSTIGIEKERGVLQYRNPNVFFAATSGIH